jgi:hypothetical protein
VFEGSFDNLASYPTPGNQTFQLRDGKQVTMLVYPGQVVVLSYTGTTDQINQLITQNEGTVTVQIPVAGVYLATIDPEKENDFIKAMHKSAVVADAFPNIVIRARGGGDESETAFNGRKSSQNGSSPAGDQNSLIQTIDLNVVMPCEDGITHKQALANVAGAGGVSVNINDVTVPENVEL